MKVVNIKGCICYLQKSSNIKKSNRKIYKNCSGEEKFKRATNNFYSTLEKTSHTKKRIARNSKKRLYTM